MNVGRADFRFTLRAAQRGDEAATVAVIERLREVCQDQLRSCAGREDFDDFWHPAVVEILKQIPNVDTTTRTGSACLSYLRTAAENGIRHALRKWCSLRRKEEALECEDRGDGKTPDPPPDPMDIMDGGWRQPDFQDQPQYTYNTRWLMNFFRRNGVSWERAADAWWRQHRGLRQGLTHDDARARVREIALEARLRLCFPPDTPRQRVKAEYADRRSSLAPLRTAHRQAGVPERPDFQRRTLHAPGHGARSDVVQ